jgi:hypothetical protein
LLTIGLIAATPASARAQGSGTWTTTGSLNTARSAHTATLLLNGQVLVTGGEDLAQNILTIAELYNPATGKWTVTGSMGDTAFRAHGNAASERRRFGRWRHQFVGPNYCYRRAIQPIHQPVEHYWQHDDAPSLSWCDAARNRRSVGCGWRQY